MKNIKTLPELIRAPRTDAIYNCHAYLTKVPYAAILPFVETFSDPGEVVADIFAGSGMTGIASVMLGRSARLSDISVLGQHIGTGYLTEISATEFKKAGERVIDKAREALGELYQTKRASDNKSVELVRTVWSFVYACPGCKHELVYFDFIDKDGKPGKTCPKCDHEFARRHWRHTTDVPVRVVVDGENKRQVEQPIATVDLRRIKEAGKDPRQAQMPSQTITEDREMYSRSGLGKAGLTETKNFFSSRNSIALLELWRAIESEKNSNIKAKLRFSFTAILARASRRYQWGPKRPLNAQNQTYYIAPIYYEWNVFELFERKVNAALHADDERKSIPLQSNCVPATFQYDLASAGKLHHLTNQSVDYVFTDPPFGSNIFYSDMNLFHETWLGKVTDESSEAVMHTTGKKKKTAGVRYEALLADAFKEAYRVLKHGRHMSVVFGNSSGTVWGLVQRALRSAGFDPSPVHVAILDKGQRSVKGLNSGSESVVTVDLVLTVRKPESNEKPIAVRSLKQGDITPLVPAAIKSLEGEKALNPSYVYVAVLREAIKRHMEVDQLHFSDVLIALRNAGHTINPTTGLLGAAVQAAHLGSKAKGAKRNTRTTAEASL